MTVHLLVIVKNAVYLVLHVNILS